MTVTVQSALTAVAASTRRLRDAAGDLVVFAEDEPTGCQVHLVTIVQDAALDLAAEAEQAGAVLEEARPPAAAQAVAACQQHLTSMGTVLVTRLAAPDRLGDLAAFGREHGREAVEWAGEIARCVAICQQLIWTDLQPALLGYWREVADLTAPPGRRATGPDLEEEGSDDG